MVKIGNWKKIVNKKDNIVYKNSFISKFSGFQKLLSVSKIEENNWSVSVANIKPNTTKGLFNHVLIVKGEETRKEALNFAQSYMRNHPRG